MYALLERVTSSACELIHSTQALSWDCSSYVVNWGVTVLPIPSVDATVSVKHVGDVLTDDGNTFGLTSYTLVDAAVSWRRGPVRFTLSAHNLFDRVPRSRRSRF